MDLPKRRQNEDGAWREQSETPRRSKGEPVQGWASDLAMCNRLIARVYRQAGQRHPRRWARSPPAAGSYRVWPRVDDGCMDGDRLLRVTMKSIQMIQASPTLSKKSGFTIDPGVTHLALR
jgi:hypothetical protein